MTAQQDGPGYEPCAKCCPTVYTNEDGSLSKGSRELTAPPQSILAGRAVIANVPARREALVIARDTASRRVVGMQRLVPHDGPIHYVAFYPLSKRELDELPSDLR